jgi:phage shock protein C
MTKKMINMTDKKVYEDYGSSRNINSSANPGSQEYQNRYEGPGPKQIYHYHPIKKLYRSTNNKWLGGVCGGLSEYFGKDPVLIRLLWVVLTLISVGVGIIAYILFWIFVDKSPSTYNLTNQHTTRDSTGKIHHHYHYRISA